MIAQDETTKFKVTGKNKVYVCNIVLNILLIMMNLVINTVYTNPNPQLEAGG